MTLPAAPTMESLTARKMEILAEIDRLQIWFAGRHTGRAGNPQGWDDRAATQDRLNDDLADLEDIIAGVC